MILGSTQRNKEKGSLIKLHIIIIILLLIKYDYFDEV